MQSKNQVVILASISNFEKLEKRPSNQTVWPTELEKNPATLLRPCCLKFKLYFSFSQCSGCIGADLVGTSTLYEIE